MSKLSTAARAALPKSDFGVPSKAPQSGSYPIPDKQHAALAKGYVKRFGSPAEQKKVAGAIRDKFGAMKQRKM